MLRFFTYSVCFVTAVALIPSSNLLADETVPLNVPQGFTATLFADDDLAHDVYCLTFDSQGRLVVSGREYVKRLIDSDGDGRADKVEVFADGPETGAQGMYFHGDDLLCVDAEGLLRYRDRDADGVADGPPERFLKTEIGGEHGPHAIRKGPDGWWYLIAGNRSGVNAKYVTLPRSPVKHPRAGVVLRLKPDLSGGEVLAEGFRNAYDFDFDIGGDLFTFDSDGERDISFPWYQPTRVFHVVPGGDAGWVSDHWKRPNYFLDMPPVVGDFGRGSPTGVVCYRHTQFPEKYRGALFIEDWTFGRVIALPLKTDGATFSSEPEQFISGAGEIGFAPTDIEVGPDGCLYVSVGGRGTRGGVYRIQYTGGDAPEETETAEEQKTDDKESVTDSQPDPDDASKADLLACLDAPQPLSSWSRKKWLPLAEKLGVGPFEKGVLDTPLSDTERIRAVQILTEVYTGISEDMATEVSTTASPAVRAAVAWALGRRPFADFRADIFQTYLIDPDPLVRRRAIESFASGAGSAHVHSLLPAMSLSLADRDRFVRHAAMRAVGELDDKTFRALGDSIPQLGWSAIIANTAGYLMRRDPAEAKVSLYAVQAAQMVLKSDHPAELKVRAARLMQLGLGGLSQRPGVPGVMSGYTAALDIEPFERKLDAARTVLAEVYPTGDKTLDHELGRLIAMLTSYNPDVLNKVLDQITDETSPTDDVHQLLIPGRIPAARTSAQRKAIARALVNIQPKMTARQMNEDSNWTDHIREMYLQLVELDTELPAELIEQPEFGDPGHMVFMNGLSREEIPRAVERLLEVVKADENYAWNNEVVFAIANVMNDETRSYLRELYEQFPLQDAVTMTLAREPLPEDRSKFLAGLESPQLEVVSSSMSALEQLPADATADEIVPLVRVLRRLQGGKQDYRLREQAVRLLRRAGEQDFAFVFGESGYTPQPDVIKKWTDWAVAKFPDRAGELTGGNEQDAEKLRERLAAVDWDAGDAARGAEIFKARSCSQCHSGARAVGPDLAGVAQRFSRDDLFIAIAQPDRDVSSRYQTTLVETNSGKLYTGRIVYHSVDGVTLRTGTNQTLRLEADEIASQRLVNTSLMPAGLLKDAEPQDLADLYRYLQSLGQPRIEAAAVEEVDE